MASIAEDYPDLKPILLVGDVAELFGITSEGVRSLIRRGQIPAAKIGKRFVIRRAALLEYLEAREEEQSRKHKKREADA